MSSLRLFALIVLISEAMSIYNPCCSNNPISCLVKYEPIMDISTLDMIRQQGYPAESHVVQTDDGYLLTLHRIPGKEGSKVVFLFHGILGGSADWVIPGKHKGLAFLLADAGYDVWLGNERGNTYSRAHVNLSPKNPKFWDFSWHEMAKYDLPAIFAYIARFNDEKLIYIGHSMGTTIFFVMASQNPDAASMVEVMIALAPVGSVPHSTSPIMMLAPFADNLKCIIDMFGHGELLSQSWFITYLIKLGCSISPCKRQMFKNVMLYITGCDERRFNETLLPLIISQVPGGTSTKTAVHYCQGYQSGKFRPYDYGCRENMLIYNRPTPPEYKLSKICGPVHFLYGDNDIIAHPSDVKTLYKKLCCKKSIYRVPDPKFSHLDFIWGINAPRVVYKKVFKILEEHGINPD